MCFQSVGSDESCPLLLHLGLLVVDRPSLKVHYRHLLDWSVDQEPDSKIKNSPYKTCIKNVLLTNIISWPWSCDSAFPR